MYNRRASLGRFADDQNAVERADVAIPARQQAWIVGQRLFEDSQCCGMRARPHGGDGDVIGLGQTATPGVFAAVGTIDCPCWATRRLGNKLVTDNAAFDLSSARPRASGDPVFGLPLTGE